MQLPREPTYKGRKDVTGTIGNAVPINSGFHTRKNLSDNPTFGHVPSRRFAIPVLGRKCSRNIVLKGHQTISHGRPARLESALME